MTLHRIPITQGDISQKAGGLTHCQWCNAKLTPDTPVWEAVGRLDHYLVCEECHQAAIVH